MEVTMALRQIVAATALIAFAAPSFAQSAGQVDCAKKANKSHAECVDLPAVSSQSIPLNLLPLLIGGTIVVGVIASGGDDDGNSSTGTN